MPLNDERPASTSSGEDQGSDVESSSERCDSMTSTSDLDCSRESFTSDSSSKHCTPSCESAQKTIFNLLTAKTAVFFVYLLSLAHIWFPTASPPKTLTLDEVMGSARDLSNLSWAHEISVNPSFHLEESSLPQGRYCLFTHVFMCCGLLVNRNIRQDFTVCMLCMKYRCSQIMQQGMNTISFLLSFYLLHYVCPSF